MSSREIISKEREKIEQRLCRSELYPLIGAYYEDGQIALAFAHAGDYISGTGKKGYQIIYILDGTVQIFSFCHSGKRVLLDEVGGGEFSGHISKVRGFNYESTLIARTDCVYLEIPDAIFDKLMKNKDFALTFYKTTSQRTYHMYRKTLALNLFTKEENVAYYLLKNSQELVIRGSLDSLSEEMGISRRSLCYLFRDWKKEKIIDRCTGGYEIKDQTRLEEIAKNVSEYNEQTAG